MKYTGEDVARVLEDARAVMNNRGRHWIKGSLRRKNKDGEVAYCSLGAINATTRNKALRIRAKRALENEIGNIVEFNDADSTKWGDVSCAFRKAARAVKKA